MSAPPRIESPSNTTSASILLILTVLSAGVSYTISILVANWIGADQFENYAVSIAMLGMFSSLAEAGTGKYALKFVPANVITKRWDLIAGFWRFSVQLVATLSVAITLVVILGDLVDDNKLGSHPIGIGVLLLFTVAGAGVSVDFIMANRMPVRGALISRLLIPGMTLLTMTAVQYSLGLDVFKALISFGFGSFVGTVTAIALFARHAPRQVFSSPPTYQRMVWIRECSYFAATAFLMNWIFRASVVVIELLPIAEREVGYFAAALETGGLVLLLSKSTDKLFQPELSVVIEEKNWEHGFHLRRKRFTLIGTGCTLFLLLMILFGKQFLALYGKEFVAGYPALICVSVGYCVWTMFSLAPSYLRFTGRDALLFIIIFLGAISMAVATAVLALPYGATGAGIAFCIVLSSVSLTFLFFANRDLKRHRNLESSQDLPSPDQG